MRRALLLALVLSGCHFSGDGVAPRDRDGDGHPDELDCAPDDARAWTELAGFADRDRHGVAPEARVCSGDTLPAGFSDAEGDCDDADAAAFRLHLYDHRDADGDGHTVLAAGAVCGGATRPAGYPEDGDGRDCDDTSAS